MIESTMKCTKSEWKKSKRWKNKAKEQPTSWDSQKQCAQFSEGVKGRRGRHMWRLCWHRRHIAAECNCIKVIRQHDRSGCDVAWAPWVSVFVCVCVYVRICVWLWDQSQTQLFELRRWQRRQCERKTERERERRAIATASRTKSLGKIFCHVINAKATVAIAIAVTVAVSMLMTLHLSVRRVRVEIVVVVVVIVIVIVNGTDASKCGYNNLCTCNDRQQSVKEQLPVVWARIPNLNPKPDTRTKFPTQTQIWTRGLLSVVMWLKRNKMRVMCASLPLIRPFFPLHSVSL